MSWIVQGEKWGYSSQRGKVSDGFGEQVVGGLG